MHWPSPPVPEYQPQVGSDAVPFDRMEIQYVCPAAATKGVGRTARYESNGICTSPESVVAKVIVPSEVGVAAE